MLNYIVTVLENLAKDNSCLEDSFDVEEFSEMLAAYIPGFDGITHSDVSNWIFDLVTTLRKESEKGKYLSAI